MRESEILRRLIFSGRTGKRIRHFSKYLYYFALESINADWSLERPVFRREPAPGMSVPPDRTNSIELHLVPNASAQKEFGQPDEPRHRQVTHVEDKHRTSSCSVCDSHLTPVIQVVNADDVSDYIEIAWCMSCDHLQYSVLPSKAWITNWYARNWDTGGTIGNKLEHRHKTYRYFHRLAPFIGDRKLKILDIGAGYGEKTAAFAEAGHEVHCTEATTRRADYLRERITPHVHFGTLDDPSVQASLRRDGPFDMIFTYHVVEHIYDARKELQILRDIAADGAIFHLAIPEFYKEGILNNVYALEHLSSFSRLSAKTLLKQCGFNPIVARDDLFQYYSNYCQYLIGRKEASVPNVGTNRDPQKIARYLTTALKLDRLAKLKGPAFSWRYHEHAPLTYLISAASKAKCRDVAAHLPLRLYHHGLPLFWMYS